MNLRFDPHSIRIRVSNDEFERLHTGKSLGLEVPMPHGHAFRAKVNQSNTADWQFDSDPTGLWLSIPRAELDALAQTLPSKDGVMHGFGTHHGELQISLEVDVKTNRAA
jgi:hypothetical protein